MIIQTLCNKSLCKQCPHKQECETASQRFKDKHHLADDEMYVPQLDINIKKSDVLHKRFIVIK